MVHQGYLQRVVREATAKIELRKHLMRLAVWSAAWIPLGLLLAAWRPGGLDAAFGLMSVGWAVVNLAIVAGGMRDRKPVDLRRLREFLALNLGLNLGYLGVGLTMYLLGQTPVEASGAAVFVQGLALLALDGWLFRALPAYDSP